MKMCLLVLRESKKSRFDSYSRQEQCIDHIPYYLSGLSRAHFSDNLSRNSCISGNIASVSLATNFTQFDAFLKSLDWHLQCINQFPSSVSSTVFIVCPFSPHAPHTLIPWYFCRIFPYGDVKQVVNHDSTNFDSTSLMNFFNYFDSICFCYACEWGSLSITTSFWIELSSLTHNSSCEWL